jgi:hypothetical protein
VTSHHHSAPLTRWARKIDYLPRAAQARREVTTLEQLCVRELKMQAAVATAAAASSPPSAVAPAAAAAAPELRCAITRSSDHQIIRSSALMIARRPHAGIIYIARDPCLSQREYRAPMPAPRSPRRRSGNGGATAAGGAGGAGAAGAAVSSRLSPRPTD